MLSSKFRPQLITEAVLDVLCRHLQTIFDKDERLPFAVTEKVLTNVQVGASSGRL